MPRGQNQELQSCACGPTWEPGRLSQCTAATAGHFDAEASALMDMVGRKKTETVKVKTAPAAIERTHVHPRGQRNGQRRRESLRGTSKCRAEPR